MQAAGAGIEVVYDGDCPFCAAYLRLVRLQAAVGPVTLIDARSGDPLVAALWAAGHDLEEGMVVRHGGRVFHGDAALRHLSVLSAPGGIWNDLLRRLFRSPRRAALLYPALVRGRRVALWVLRRGRLARPGE